MLERAAQASCGVTILEGFKIHMDVEPWVSSGLAVLGEWMDLVISKDFSNLNDSLIPF